MKDRKPPDERKAEEYAKEVRYKAWHSAQADRRNRPLVKAIELRRERRKVREVLPLAEDPETTEQAETAMDAATRHHKWHGRYSSTAIVMEEWLADRRRRRVDQTARNFFKDEYDPAEDREPFSRFLADVMSGGTQDSVELARLFRELLELDPFEKAARRRFPVWPPRALWLRAYLRDRPDMEAPLRGWIEAMLRT